jgi:hypothetical protein
MPHIPGHTETAIEDKKGIFNIITKKDEKDLAKKHLGKAEDIIGRKRADLLRAQKSQFEQSRRAFQERLNLALGAQVGQARKGFVQAAGRRGLTGSGVEQAGVQAVRAAGQQQFAQSLGEFETKLSLAQEQERSQFRGRSFDFLARIATMAAQTDFEKELLRFQAQIAADAQKSQQFGNMLNLGAQVAATYFGGPAGGAAASQVDFGKTPF